MQNSIGPCSKSIYHFLKEQVKKDMLNLLYLNANMWEIGIISAPLISTK